VPLLGLKLKPVFQDTFSLDLASALGACSGAASGSLSTIIEESSLLIEGSIFSPSLLIEEASWTACFAGILSKSFSKTGLLNTL
jgi:hypothetical protein